MASKTSFFNKAILKKDLTRFAPLWVGYTALIVLSLLFNSYQPYAAITGMADSQGMLMLIFAYLSVLYAPIAAAFLFKDLFNTRLCYTLHSLPVSRGALFGSHILSGFLFQLIPVTAMTLVSLPFLFPCSQVTGAPYISLVAWAAANLQYLFYFGLATLCMMCVGNLLGFAAMYGLLNVAGLGIYFLAYNLFRPLLKGVEIPRAPFIRITPFAYINENGFFRIEQVTLNTIHDGTQLQSRNDAYQVLIGNAWPYAIAIGAIGLLLIAAALLIYRRRNLETAGEFVSYKPLRPLILLSISLASGITAVLLLSDINPPFVLRMLCMLLGMTLGYFLGLMLLNRSAKVFQRKNWVRLGLMLATMVLLLGVTKLDPLGIVTRLPAREDIVSMSLYYRLEDNSMDSPDEIDDMRLLHSLALEETLSDSSDSNPERYASFRLTYDLKNGTHMERSYLVHVDGEAGQLLRKHITTLKFVIGQSQIDTPEDLLALVSRPGIIYVSAGNMRYRVPEEHLTEGTVEALYNALISDCQEGTMAPKESFHPPVAFPDDEEEYFPSGDIQVYFPWAAKEDVSFCFFSDSRNILAWLDTVGVDSATFWDRYYSG